MRIIIFHYHLNPGGVTRIIESQIAAIKKTKPEQKVIVITGDCQNIDYYQKNKVELLINPDLNYLTDPSEATEKYSRITNFLNNFCRSDDILHIHNLNLGKNPLVTLAISKLAYKGYPVINHAHDFSEDRPANQQFLNNLIVDTFGEDLNKTLYPNLNNYIFITLNSFDGRRLEKYGVKPTRCNVLANPVVFAQNKPKGSKSTWKQEICQELDLDPNKLIVTYPVRVIKRKNIGEFILLAALLGKKANWVATQPPKNPMEIELYLQWKKFCVAKNIKVTWEAGTKVDFEKLIRVSDFCISTSIQEGFGMVFMEPWLLDTPVIGRNIPMVTNDMIDEGLTFPLLYDKLILENQKQLHTLPLEEQMQFIGSVLKNPEKAKEILTINPFIDNMLRQPDETTVEQNKNIILSKYSLNNYGSRLNGVYREIIKHTR